eukprot:m.169851 g.169851  ORF g.169851 m.169851 type:complete len:394 (+) comp10373_c1_seq4:1297-2478(+)
MASPPVPQPQAQAAPPRAVVARGYAVEAQPLGAGNFSNVFRGTAPNRCAVALKVTRFQQSQGCGPVLSWPSSPDGMYPRSHRDPTADHRTCMLCLLRIVLFSLSVCGWCFCRSYRARSHCLLAGIAVEALRELAVLGNLRHPNVVPLYDVVLDRDSITLVLGLAIFSLTAYLDAWHRQAPLAEVPKIATQLLQGLEYCREKSVVHRDLKPSNILIGSDGHLWIADWASGRQLTMETPPLNHKVVSLWFRAPELLMGCPTYGPEVDIWAAGCILAECSTGMPLFPGKSEEDQLLLVFAHLGPPDPATWPEARRLSGYERSVALHVLHNPAKGPSLSSKLSRPSKPLRMLITSMLSLSPEARPSPRSLLTSPLLAKLRDSPCSVKMPPSKRKAHH